MKDLNKQFLLYTLTFLLSTNSLIFYGFSSCTQLPKTILHTQVTRNQNIQYTDSSAQKLQLLYKASLKNKDTLQAINILELLSENYSHQGNHKETYDKLWSALLLADAAKMDLAKSDIYKDIGRHYNYFNRREKSLEFLNLSLNIKKELVNKGELDKSALAENYLAFVSSFRELNQLKLGKIYLDSCFMHLSSSVKESRQLSVKFEHAVILNHEKKHKEALKTFNEVFLWFSKNRPSYNVLVYTYMGDTYRSLNNYSESEKCYANALETSNIFNAHKDFTPLIHEKLADLYFSLGKNIKAYSSLKKAKELDDIYFDSRSVNNRPLLEIHDAFLEEKTKQSINEQDQRLLQLEQEEKVLFLQKIILIGVVVFLIIFGLLSLSNLRSKHKAEKILFKKKRDLEIQKNKEVIELKNKELATSVIKLIEKDSFIDKLKNKLSDGKGDINRYEAKQIISSISNNNIENWTEFETRFVSINKKFYKKLNNKFPNLTVNDQRLCALVKLNFSSKEIARLLSMSTDSVHTTRSRLRKKLELSRNINLKQFIADI